MHQSLSAFIKTERLLTGYEILRPCESLAKMDVLDFTPEISVIQLPSKANLEVELTDLSRTDLSSALVAKD